MAPNVSPSRPHSAKFWMSANTLTLVLAPFHKFLVPYQVFLASQAFRMWHQNLGRLQGDSRTEMLQIIDRYGHVHNCREVNVVIVARRLSIADTRLWRVDTRTGQFVFDDAVGCNYNGHLANPMVLTPFSLPPSKQVTGILG